MKIAFLNSGLQARGGADRWLLGMIAHLRQTWPQLQTVLLVGREDPKLPDHERARIGPVRRVKGLERRGLRAAGGAAALRRLAQVLDELAPDRIHCNDIVDPQLLSLVAATGRGLATVQDHRHFCPGSGKVLPDGTPCNTPLGPACATCLPDAAYRDRVLDLTQQRLAALRQLRTVTVLSTYMQAQLHAHGIASLLTPPCVDHLPPSDRQPARHHLFIGRLAHHKGIDVAVQAARHTRLPLVVAGEGPVTVPDSLGWVDRPQLARLLAQAATVWVPSLWAEPFGIVGLEALAAGAPVIGSNRGGMESWLVHQQTGLVVPPGDAVALAAAADRLTAEPQLAATLGAQGRDLVSTHFSAHAAGLALRQALMV